MGQDIDGEHRELMESAISRDAEKAFALMTLHVRFTADVPTESGLTV